MAKLIESRMWFQVIIAHAVVLLLGSSIFGFSGSGSGTESDPYVITNVQQLQDVNDDSGAHYILGNDIDAWGTQSWNGGEGFVPIGTFTGVLDGRGHSIDGLHINRIGQMHQGLFSVLGGAVVTNVHLTNANVTFNSHGGTLAAHANNGTVISYCSATGTVVLKPGTSDGRGGGLLGNVRTGSRVERCWANVDVSAGGRRQVGGVVGYLRGVESGPIALLLNSYSLGTVTGTGSKQGNLLGDADGSHVQYCYSAGSGKALIGYNYRHPTIRDCYWDGTKGASSSSYGGIPKTTEQMMQQATFLGWEFVETWFINENLTYPYLILPVMPVRVAVDIKPGSCPNPLNPGSRGVLPVAVLGSAQFDVTEVDLASIRLAGVSPVRSGFEDVATAVAEANECDCTDVGGDGFVDLTLKFKTSEIAEQLIGMISDLAKGDQVALTLTGATIDQTPIVGEDCVIIVGKVPQSLKAKKADINEDGMVNMSDFGVMAGNWLVHTSAK